MSTVSISIDDATLAAERLAEHAENIIADRDAMPSDWHEWHSDLTNAAFEYQSAARRISAAVASVGRVA